MSTNPSLQWPATARAIRALLLHYFGTYPEIASDWANMRAMLRGAWQGRYGRGCEPPPDEEWIAQLGELVGKGIIWLSDGGYRLL